MPAIAVFDTNVLFSAAGWQGAPYQCVELARSGAVAAATHVVTGDRRHLLPLRSYAGIPIVTPADFLTAVAKS